MEAEKRQSVVFIDLDHTLLEGPFESSVFPLVVGELAQKSGQDYNALLNMVRQENRQRQNSPAFSAVQAMDWDDIFTQAARRLGVRLQTNAREIVLSHSGRPYTGLHDGALETLDALSRGKPERALVLATKGLLKYQLPLLEALQIRLFFDDILTPDSTQALKNTIGFYSHWPETTRLQIMVGDNYADDIQPARAFGFKTVWLRLPDVPVSAGYLDRPYETSPDPNAAVIRPDAVISSLHDLPEVIYRLESELV